MTRRKALILAGSGVLGAAAAAAGGGAAFIATGEVKFSNRFYPGTRMDGEDLGGLTYAQALARARARWDVFAANPVSFRLRERTWQPSGRDAGVRVDYLTPLGAAYAWGREGDWITRLSQQREAAETPHDWRTQVTFDPQPFSGVIEGIAAELGRPAAEGSLRLEERGGRQVFVIAQSASGQRLAPADYLGVMSREFEPPKRLLIDLALETVPATVSSAGFEPVAEEARRLLDGHILLLSPFGRWSVRREDLATDLRLVGTTAAPRVEFDVDYRAFERVASDLARKLRIEPVEPKIRVNPEGEIVPTVRGREGRTVDVETLWARVQAAFQSGADEVQVPIIVLTPDVGRLSARELQFDNVVATGTSFFWGSAWNRVHNIDNGSAKIDGTVVAPGEQFSLNAVVGSITLANGFVEGLVIAPNRTEPGVGGGICQVSTTLFRALFWAGLPVVERWQHVYRVGYYELGPEPENPPGFDAAIWQPSQDLRFTNDTPNSLLIRRDFSERTGTLQFHIMGAPIGRKIELGSWRGKLVPPPPMKVEPDDELAPGEARRTDTAVAGMQVVIYRTVSFGDRVLFKDRFPSQFRAWPERWEVGPNEDGTLDTSAVPGYVPEGGEAAGNVEVRDEGATPDAAT